MDQTQMNRRLCNRMGLGLLGYMATMLVVSTILGQMLGWLAPGLVSNTMVLMTVNDLCNYLAAPAVLWLIIRPLPVGRLPRRNATWGRLGKLTLESIGLMYGFSLVTNLVMTAISAIAGRETGNLLDTVTQDMSPWAAFLFMVLIAPVCEEFIFRGLVLRRMLPLGEGVAVVVSALSFGLFHCNLYQFFYATALGLFFGCVMVKTGQLRYSILLHAILNFLGSTVTMAVGESGVAATVYTVLIYLLMTAGLVILWRDRRNLLPRPNSRPESWKAAFTAPALLVFYVLFLVLSVAVAFLV